MHAILIIGLPVLVAGLALIPILRRRARPAVPVHQPQRLKVKPSTPSHRSSTTSAPSSSDNIPFPVYRGHTGASTHQESNHHSLSSGHHGHHDSGVSTPDTGSTDRGGGNGDG